jgi:hypothetical protein
MEEHNEPRITIILDTLDLELVAAITNAIRGVMDCTSIASVTYFTAGDAK